MSSRAKLGGLNLILVMLTMPQILPPGVTCPELVVFPWVMPASSGRRVLLTGQLGGAITEPVAGALVMVVWHGWRSMLWKLRPGRPSSGLTTLALAAAHAPGLLRSWGVRGWAGGFLLSPGPRLRDRRGRVGIGLQLGARR